MFLDVIAQKHEASWFPVSWSDQQETTRRRHGVRPPLCPCRCPAGKAIAHTAETFFNQEKGGRRGHPRVILVLIDGWPSDNLEQAAMLAREFGINVFLVAVAKPAPEELAMVPDKDFMKKV